MKIKKTTYLIIRAAVLLLIAVLAINSTIVAWFVNIETYGNGGFSSKPFEGAGLETAVWDDGGWLAVTGDEITVGLGTVNSLNEILSLRFYFRLKVSISTDYDYGYFGYIKNIRANCYKNGETLTYDGVNAYVPEDAYYTTAGGFGLTCKYVVSADAAAGTAALFPPGGSDGSEVGVKNYQINSEMVGSGEGYLYVELTPNDNLISILGHIPIREMPYVFELIFDISGEARTV